MTPEQWRKAIEIRLIELRTSPAPATTSPMATRRARLHDMIDRLPEEELLGVQLFLELLVEPAPGEDAEQAALLEQMLLLLLRMREKPPGGSTPPAA
jgi:hypothetical protein